MDSLVGSLVIRLVGLLLTVVWLVDQFFILVAVVSFGLISFGCWLSKGVIGWLFGWFVVCRVGRLFGYLISLTVCCSCLISGLHCLLIAAY